MAIVQTRRYEREMKLTPEEALEKMEDEDYAYVDVRSINEFEGGHPVGAYNIPFKHMLPGGMADNEDFVAVMEASFAKDAKLIVACKAGGRAKPPRGFWMPPGLRMSWTSSRAFPVRGTSLARPWNQAGRLLGCPSPSKRKRGGTMRPSRRKLGKPRPRSLIHNLGWPLAWPIRRAFRVATTLNMPACPAYYRHKIHNPSITLLSTQVVNQALRKRLGFI